MLDLWGGEWAMKMGCPYKKKQKSKPREGGEISNPHRETGGETLKRVGKNWEGRKDVTF